LERNGCFCFVTAFIPTPKSALHTVFTVKDVLVISCKVLVASVALSAFWSVAATFLVFALLVLVILLFLSLMALVHQATSLIWLAYPGCGVANIKKFGIWILITEFDKMINFNGS